MSETPSEAEFRQAAADQAEAMATAQVSPEMVRGAKQFLNQHRGRDGRLEPFDVHRLLSAAFAKADATPQKIKAEQAIVVVIGWLVEHYPSDQVLIQKLQVYLSRLEQAPQS